MTAPFYVHLLYNSKKPSHKAQADWFVVCIHGALSEILELNIRFTSALLFTKTAGRLVIN